VRGFAARLRTAAWLGWQVESNWADPFIFAVYAVLRPLATALILAGMYWAVGGLAGGGAGAGAAGTGAAGGALAGAAAGTGTPAIAAAALFAAIWIGNAFHTYVTQVLVAMGWVVVEEREDYETLKYVYAAPIGMFAYLAGRSTVKLVLATLSMVLTLIAGWFVVDVRWEWGAVAWGPLAAAFALGIVATVSLGFMIAGVALLLPRAAMTINEGFAVSLYLVCGVIFPVDLLPRGLQELSLALPFTWWYEALRRALLGHGISARLSTLSDGALLAVLLGTTLVFALLSRTVYLGLETRARRLGRLDQTTMF
jgi:ABC-2 type transport system permease protein